MTPNQMGYFPVLDAITESWGLTVAHENTALLTPENTTTPFNSGASKVRRVLFESIENNENQADFMMNENSTNSF